MIYILIINLKKEDYKICFNFEPIIDKKKYCFNQYINFYNL